MSRQLTGARSRVTGAADARLVVLGLLFGYDVQVRPVAVFTQDPGPVELAVLDDALDVRRIDLTQALVTDTPLALFEPPDWPAHETLLRPPLWEVPSAFHKNTGKGAPCHHSLTGAFASEGDVVGIVRIPSASIGDLSAGIGTSSEKFDRLGMDFREPALDAVLLIRPRADVALDVELFAFRNVLVADLGELAPGDDIVPFGMGLSVLVLETGFRGRQAELRHVGPGWKRSEIDISSNVSDENDLVNTHLLLSSRVDGSVLYHNE